MDRVVCRSRVRVIAPYHVQIFRFLHAVVAYRKSQIDRLEIRKEAEGNKSIERKRSFNASWISLKKSVF